MNNLDQLTRLHWWSGFLTCAQIALCGLIGLLAGIALYAGWCADYFRP